jgi:hemerythrin
MFVVWNDQKYSVGISMLDEQHKQLLSIANDLYELLSKKKYRAEALNILNRLYTYTEYHFICEEGLLLEHNYPGLDEHIEHHTAFTKQVRENIALANASIDYPIEKLMTFLKDWILNHLQKEDRRYCDFFKEENINPNIHFSLSQDSNADIVDLWDSEQLSLGIKDIDSQHKELIYILQQTNDLQKIPEERRKKFLPVIIKKLFYYSRYHFLYEENSMQTYGYPGLEKHKVLHAQFIDDLNKFAEEFKSGANDLTIEIVMYLKEWTVTHILQEDKKFKDFILSHKENK